MWKSFVLELHGEWSEFAAEYDHSATLTQSATPGRSKYEACAGLAHAMNHELLDVISSRPLWTVS